MWQYAFASVLIVMPTIGAFGSGQGAPDRFWIRQCYFLTLAMIVACTVFLSLVLHGVTANPLASLIGKDETNEKTS